MCVCICVCVCVCVCVKKVGVVCVSVRAIHLKFFKAISGPNCK